MFKIVLLRHGESIYNQEDRFAGWCDVDLSRRGKNQAKRAGRILKEQGYTFDMAYTSLLKRAIRTLWITLDVMDLLWIPKYHSWRLNERHHGAFQGLSRKEAREQFGEEILYQFRRNYDFKPPVQNEHDARHYTHDPRYQELGKGKIPLSESMRDATSRFLPYWQEVLVPAIQSGRRILIVAHGNILRSLIKHLNDISKEEIVTMHVLANGIPLVYELSADLKVLKHYYLAKFKERPGIFWGAE